MGHSGDFYRHPGGGTRAGVCTTPTSAWADVLPAPVGKTGIRVYAEAVPGERKHRNGPKT